TNMKAWLFAIMRNLFWDRFKGSRKEDVSLDDLGEFVLYDKLRDEGARPEADVLDKIAASEVVAAVDKLPPLHREVVLLVDVDGFSYKDAAQTLGVPIGTVMSRLHRARQQLQRSLYDYAVESGIVHTGGRKGATQPRTARTAPTSSTGTSIESSTTPRFWRSASTSRGVP